LILALAACAADATPEPAPQPAEAPQEPPAVAPEPVETVQEEPAPEPEEEIKTFPGKIAIVTYPAMFESEDYIVAKALQQEYGDDKIILQAWPEDYFENTDMMITILQEIAEDPDVNALIIGSAVSGTNDAVDKFREARDDVFIVYCSPSIWIEPADIASRADLTLSSNHLLIDELYAKQAKAMGAETIAFYSIERHMSNEISVARRDSMKAGAASEGLEFIEIHAPDPMFDSINATIEFIENDITERIEANGTDTAFFGTGCVMQVPIITRVVENNAIFVQPCCPSPYHGYPDALEITTRYPSLEEIKQAVSAQGMSGRISGWPVSSEALWTETGFEYAIKVLNGDVDRDNIDINALESILQSITDSTGASVGVKAEALNQNGTTYSNYILAFIDFYIF